jgi:hypothetical protein
MGFYGQHVLSYKKRNVVKEANEVMCNALFATWLKHYTLTLTFFLLHVTLHIITYYHEW